MNRLANYVQGQWLDGQGQDTILRDPVLGDPLASVGADGIDVHAAYAWARQQAGPALRALSYAQRAELLGKAAAVLQANRDKYFDIALRNSGTVHNDSAVDIDGGIYTLSWYAKAGGKLTGSAFLADGDADALARDPAFAARHILVPVQGLALLINAFNFPAWGLWEKAAPALLSGVPIVVKPATATAWLTHEMIKDVVDAGIFPAGAISLICGRPAGLLDALAPLDLVSFTGSADTAAAIRQHPRLRQDAVRLNAETDSVNCAILGPDASPAALELLVREVLREMTSKSGQKCTAIRRILVPQQHYLAVGQAIADKLRGVKVGDPRNPDVRMGSLVSRQQYDTVMAGIAQMAEHADLIFDGRRETAILADTAMAACAAPVLFGIADPDDHPLAHTIEIFGPVASLMPYRDAAHAWQLARRAQGSLVASVYSDDTQFLADAAMHLADSHGRVHLVNPAVAKTHTGHGNVMPQSNHGGPGRAGGGQELGGLRALRFYHRLCAIQAEPAVLEALQRSHS